jgi:hypothetical protein
LMECSNKEAMTDLVWLHTHVALSWCSSIWSQVQNGLKCQIGQHQESERCWADLDKLQKYLVESVCCNGT